MASFRGATLKQAEGITRKMRLGEKHRQRAEHQDQQRPRGKMHQQHRKADQRDKVLREPQAFCDEAQWPGRRIAAHAHQLVVKGRVLELQQRKGLGLFQDHQVDLLPQLHPQ